MNRSSAISNPPGPKACACCASTVDVERHHLYSVHDGCPDDLQIWLCHLCHERVHGTQMGGLHYGKLKRDGIERAKAKGTKFGRPKISAETEAAIRERLQAGVGILKTGRLVGAGSSTVQRVRKAMDAELATVRVR